MVSNGPVEHHTPQIGPLDDQAATVLVVGAGFIGSHICRHLATRGHRVRALTRSTPEPSHARLLSDAELVVADAADSVAVDHAMRDVDWVVFGAGGLVPAASQADPLQDVTIALKPLLTVLETVRRSPGTAITYLSSGGTVYGPSMHDRCREDSPTEPMTSYGVLKLAGEKYTGMYAQQDGTPIRILRCANVYGLGQRTSRGQGAVAAFLDCLTRNQPIVLHGDGSIVRDFVHVSDIANAVDLLRPKPSTNTRGQQVVNVGTGTGTSLAALLRAVEQATGKQAIVEKRPARHFDVARNVLDISRLQRLTGLQPLGLPEGLRRTARLPLRQ